MHPTKKFLWCNFQVFANIPQSGHRKIYLCAFYATDIDARIIKKFLLSYSR